MIAQLHSKMAMQPCAAMALPYRHQRHVPAAHSQLHSSQRLAGAVPGARLNPARHAATSTSRGRTSTVTVQARYSGGPPAVPDRVIGALPYLLPLFDGLRYGKFVFMQYPVFANVLAPFEPLIRLYFSVPFAGLVAFFAVYLGIINNPSLSRFVRFNAMQAVLLDVILILPGLIESVLRIQPMGGAGLQIYITLYNTIFFFLFACVVYGVGGSLAGREARLPIVAEAADAQVR